MVSLVIRTRAISIPKAGETDIQMALSFLSLNFILTSVLLFEITAFVDNLALIQSKENWTSSNLSSSS